MDNNVRRKSHDNKQRDCAKFGMLQEGKQMTEADRFQLPYERHDLTERLREALSNAGLADKQLSPLDLAPLDQFHVRGFEATKELVQALTITPQTKVLDIGSGLGGPARFLAATFGCDVRGVDVTQSYVDAAKFLTDRAGLADKVSFDCANALSLPYADGSFDLAWTQHVAMNIADRTGLYAEVFRVLKSGGHFAIYDVVAGVNGPVHFPVPWSDGPDTSFLMTPDSMRDALTEQGFRILTWLDRTEAGIAWFTEFQKRQSQASEVQPALGLNIVVGPDFGARAANLARSMKEGRAGLVEAVVVRE
jgi:ubiquinone/menaquinone biosynthesis C-methylase UbiE